jgi:pyrroline-5-carboxylate reductase
MHTHTITERIAIIGAGTMGRAIASGMVRAGVVSADQLTISDRDPAASGLLAESLHGAVAASDNAAACAGADIVLLCVKPHDVARALSEIGATGTSRASAGEADKALLVSIVAGVSIATIDAATGGRFAVVRAMPNTPCLIGKGLTVLSSDVRVAARQHQSALTIFAALGRCLTLEERHFDAVTAVSASGPAFLYVVIEAIAAGGVSCGLPRDVATEMAAQTAFGAAAMVLATGKHPAALRDDVTSPGGCTIAGLLALEDGRLRSVVARAVEVTARAAAGLGR